MYYVIAVLAFGLLIAIHELGHFFAAKLMGVRVIEFAIGMGPKLLKKQGKETLYTLRALPFGGFCAMEGEDSAIDDERAFTSQKRWKRAVILLAGSAANFIAAFIIIVIIIAGANSFVGTTVTSLPPTYTSDSEQSLMVGDTIVSVNGERLFYSQDFFMFMNLSRGGGAELVVRRDGEINNLSLERREFIENGEVVYRFGLTGITFNEISATFAEQMRYSFYTAFNFVRLIRVSLVQLISGYAGLGDLAGPLGIVNAMNDIAQQSPSVGDAIENIVFFTAFIAVNLSVMNLLPIPALDGGRILFLGISWFIEKVIRRKLDPKYEGYIHAGAMVLLFGLMFFVLFNDVINIINP